MREWRDVHAQLLDTLAGARRFPNDVDSDGVQTLRSGYAAINATVTVTNSRRKAPAERSPRVRHPAVSRDSPQHSGRAARKCGASRRGERRVQSHARSPRDVVSRIGAFSTRGENEENRRDVRRSVARARRRRTRARRDGSWRRRSWRRRGSTRARWRESIRSGRWSLGAHLVRVSHSEPFWNEQNGRVMVKQRTRLYGLELDSRGGELRENRSRARDGDFHSRRAGERHRDLPARFHRSQSCGARETRRSAYACARQRLSESGRSRVSVLCGAIAACGEG